jgi:hypothetical protein
MQAHRVSGRWIKRPRLGSDRAQSWRREEESSTRYARPYDGAIEEHGGTTG